EKITLHENCLEGELRLLKSPQFETESIVYRYLIAGWVKFLGGKLPNVMRYKNPTPNPSPQARRGLKMSLIRAETPVIGKVQRKG
ncbi:MAG: hypothetical protein ACK468_00265, partial [Dolichospermum sp.]